MSSSKEETQLIESALIGNQSAYKRLYENHVDGLYCFLSQFTDNTLQNEEWTQRAFIKAFNKLSQFKSNSSFKTWLFTIALNEMRTDMRNKIHFENIEDHHLETDTSENIEESNIWQQAKSAIKQLSPERRIICLLHIAEGYSHSEIAGMIGITEGSSRTILHRAKKELKNIVSA